MNVLLLDDHQVFGQSLKRLLEDQEEITSCDYAKSPEQFFRLLSSKAYDLVLVDINLKRKDTGLDVIHQLKEKNFALPVIILTAYDLANYQSLAYDLGVQDFINKSVEIDDLLARIKKASLGFSQLRQEVILDPLTPRELEILQKLVQGGSKKEVADALFISQRTLYNHLANIYSKFQVNSLIEAYNKAMELGYIRPKI